VDGASEWHLFRYITLPLLSPITFYLSILGFIGTFKSFNSIYVMRSPEARGTTDTIAIVVFDTFRQAQRYGEATAQAILLMLIILAITQFQRSFLERRVFYG
jgi:ABC-type sugar transport system permease subunit